MARARSHRNGRFEESLTAMQQAQAQMLQALATTLARMAETDAAIAESRRQSEDTNRLNSERFERIEALLAEHSRIMAELPEAVHRRFGLQPPQGKVE